jgi:hypothetical protein
VKSVKIIHNADVALFFNFFEGDSSRNATKRAQVRRSGPTAQGYVVYGSKSEEQAKEI